MQQNNKDVMRLQKELQTDQTQFEQYVQTLPEQTHALCVQQFSKDVNKYADCMGKKSKVIEKQLRAFEFRMLFMNHQFDSCIKGNGGDRCVDEAKHSVQGFINDIKKNIN